jgi:hypothetical protein
MKRKTYRFPVPKAQLTPARNALQGTAFLEEVSCLCE